MILLRPLGMILPCAEATMSILPNEAHASARQKMRMIVALVAGPGGGGGRLTISSAAGRNASSCRRARTIGNISSPAAGVEVRHITECAAPFQRRDAAARLCRVLILSPHIGCAIQCGSRTGSRLVDVPHCITRPHALSAPPSRRQRTRSRPRPGRASRLKVGSASADDKRGYVPDQALVLPISAARGLRLPRQPLNMSPFAPRTPLDSAAPQRPCRAPPRRE